MKQMKIISCLLLLLVVVIGSNHLFGQEKKNMITFGSMVTRFNDIELHDLHQSFDGYYEYPAGLGMDAIYYRCLTPNTRFGVGLSWQHGRVASYLSALRRFRYDEVNVPYSFTNRFYVLL